MRRKRWLLAVLACISVCSQAATLWVKNPSPAISVPTGASDLGYTTLLFNEYPKTADIVNAKNGAYKWYNGLYFESSASVAAEMAYYSDTNGVLTIAGNDTTAQFISAPNNWTQSGASVGKLPMIPARNGYYVEFDIALSANDTDCLSAVWLQTGEHHGLEDEYGLEQATDYKRWIELDVLETHFTANKASHSHHNWSGIEDTTCAPSTWCRDTNTNATEAGTTDFTQRIRWGVSFQPSTRTIRFYKNDVLIVTSDIQTDPNHIQQHMYPTISHGKHSGSGAGTCTANMYVYNVQAWVP